MEPNFPQSVTLVDTGERRHPRDLEYYFWYNPKTDKVSGPWDYVKNNGEDEDWFSPEQYAIYKVVTNG